ncbi:MAG: NAD-dependent dihydropyrimidine dehydrogenase subunit PreA [Planctomycetes bacterium]|nr:NAD-dependent dihydropyrimidine dehydrogenase subunit PreA [Planctomycetota bacterium]MCB9905525.1 NAD-dependent dihydropyrimidine dehydrogenase subunit PreA [Planctomycetota bacterium]
MTDLSITVDGIKFPNPFVLASGPPGTNGKVIQRSFELGWGGIVCKTLSLENEKVTNVVPRYGKLTADADSKQVIGFQNIELISDRPFDVWLEELRQCKEAYPDHALIASIMEEFSKDRWVEITERVQETGVDAFELNLSCPHGLPERKMGAAMGQDPEIVEEVTSWVKSVSKVPVWAKMTPNITDITVPSKAAVRGGADGISAINTILGIIGINLDTLRPMPTVEGYSEPGGYSGRAVRPLALRQVMEIARACPGVSISGMGGVMDAEDAIMFLAVGASTVQVCTGAMLQGYEMISKLEDGLAAFMGEKGFNSVTELVGASLPYFTTHADLVERQRAAKRAKAGQANRDEMWKGDIAKETDSLVTD